MCLYFLEWGLQQTHPSSVHGASEPWRFWEPFFFRGNEDTAVGELSDAAVQEVQ